MGIIPDDIDFSIRIGYCMLRKCTPTWKIEKAQIRFHDLTLLVEGEAEYIINNIRYKASAGDLIYVPKGATREAVTSPGKLMKCYCINFYLHDFKGNDEVLPFPTISRIGLKPDIISLYEDAFREWICQLPSYRLKVHGIFLLILRRYYGLIIFKNDLSTIDSRIQSVIRHMTDHYDESLLIKDLADQLNISPVYLGTLFKKAMGMSFHQYLMEIRLNSAENILLGGGHTIKEAALLSGFNDAFHLSKEFKKSRGIPPSKLFRPILAKSKTGNSYTVAGDF